MKQLSDMSPSRVVENAEIPKFRQTKISPNFVVQKFEANAKVSAKFHNYHDANNFKV